MTKSEEVKIDLPNSRLFLNDLPDDFDFDSSSIAIDTEAMGLKIGRDRLCLVQMANEKGEVAFVKVDVVQKPSAPNLQALLTDKKIEKIFHFARFDVSLIYQTFGILIENIYCTKIASKLVRTYTDGHGLKDLVREALGISLNKAQQSSDWGAKNLSEEQLKYAAGDVIYLHKVKSYLDGMISRENKKEMLNKCLTFLPARAYLDVCGYEAVDIFAHS